MCIHVLSYNYYLCIVIYFILVGIKLCTKQQNAEIARHQGGPPIVGAFVPSCKLNGGYEEVQCHGSTGFCWCVDKLGNEIQGTRTRGEPNCTLSGMVDSSNNKIQVLVTK